MKQIKHFEVLGSEVKYDLEVGDTLNTSEYGECEIVDVNKNDFENVRYSVRLKEFVFYNVTLKNVLIYEPLVYRAFYRAVYKLGRIYSETMASLFAFFIITVDRTLGAVIRNIIEGITGRKL